VGLCIVEERCPNRSQWGRGPLAGMISARGWFATPISDWASFESVLHHDFRRQLVRWSRGLWCLGIGEIGYTEGDLLRRGEALWRCWREWSQQLGRTWSLPHSVAVRHCASDSRTLSLPHSVAVRQRASVSRIYSLPHSVAVRHCASVSRTLSLPPSVAGRQCASVSRTLSLPPSVAGRQCASVRWCTCVGHTGCALLSEGGALWLGGMQRSCQPGHVRSLPECMARRDHVSIRCWTCLPPA
jgi:hypothetical protein